MNDKLEKTYLGDYMALSEEFFLRKNSDLSHLDLKMKLQDLEKFARSITVGIRATIWTKTLKTFVIPLKGGGQRILDIKVMYPTLEIPFKDKPHTTTVSLRDISPSRLIWHKIDPDKEYETIEGVEELRDNSLELENQELRMKLEESERRCQELEEDIEDLRSKK